MKELMKKLKADGVKGIHLMKAGDKNASDILQALRIQRISSQHGQQLGGNLGPQARRRCMDGHIGKFV